MTGYRVGGLLDIVLVLRIWRWKDFFENRRAVPNGRESLGSKVGQICSEHFHQPVRRERQTRALIQFWVRGNNQRLIYPLVISSKVREGLGWEGGRQDDKWQMKLIDRGKAPLDLSDLSDRWRGTIHVTPSSFQFRDERWGWTIIWVARVPRNSGLGKIYTVFYIHKPSCLDLEGINFEGRI